MGRVINFPSESRFSGEKKNYVRDSILFPKEGEALSQSHEELFVGLLREWPCFSKMDSKINMTDVLNHYCDEKLTVSQQFVLDFMLHIQDPKFIFNISHALLSWGGEDREFFFLFLEKHLEVQDIMYNL